MVTTASAPMVGRGPTVRLVLTAAVSTEALASIPPTGYSRPGATVPELDSKDRNATLLSNRQMQQKRSHPKRSARRAIPARAAK